MMVSEGTVGKPSSQLGSAVIVKEEAMVEMWVGDGRAGEGRQRLVEEKRKEREARRTDPSMLLDQ